jgi:hypothetical protein
MNISKRWRRIGPMLLLLAFISGTLVALSTLGYCVGRNTETDLRFLEPRRAPTVDEAAIAYPIEYSLRSNETNDVIFLGDSTCRCGIETQRFEELSGLRAYNLGSQGKAGPMAFVLTAKAYLLKHPLPQIVVLCISPVVSDLGGYSGDAKMQARLMASYGPEVAGLVPPIESLIYFVKRGSLTALAAPSNWSIGHNEDVRDVPLGGLEADSYRSLQLKMRESRGYSRLPGAHHAERARLERRGQPVTIREDWDRSVRLLAETCHSMQIPLLIRFSPMPSECSQMRDFSPVERWAKDLETSCPQLIVGRPTLLWYPWDLCWDSFHLNASGVARFMPVLATEIRTALENRDRSSQK